MDSLRRWSYLFMCMALIGVVDWIVLVTLRLAVGKLKALYWRARSGG